MAELNYKVDNTDTQENQFDPIPAGDYTAVIEDSDYMPTKNNTGMYLKLVYQIIDGTLKGRKLFENLNLENENQQAVQIAKRALNAIGVACGIADVKDSAMLHNIPFKISVGMKKNKETDEMGNVIKKHLPLSDAAPAADGPSEDQQSSSTAKATPTAKATSTAKPATKKHPWEK